MLWGVKNFKNCKVTPPTIKHKRVLMAKMYHSVIHTTIFDEELYTFRFDVLHVFFNKKHVYKKHEAEIRQKLKNI